MYNSKYTGQQVEALLDSVSGKTIYTQGSGITIEDGAIGVSSALTSDFVSNERFESLEEVVAQALISGDTPDMSGYYTSAQTDTLLAAKQDTLVSGTNIKTINNTSILGEGNIEISGGGSTPVDLSAYYTSAETLNQIGIASAATMTAVSQAIENEHYLTSADTQNFITSADTQDFVTETRFESLEETVANFMVAIPEESLVTTADTQNFITSADTQSFVTTAVTSSLESRIAALEALLLVTGVNSAYTVVQMTEAEYSATTKNANTIYYVTSGATA